MQFWQMIIDVIIGIWYIFVIILIPYILFLVFNKNFNFKRPNKIIVISEVIALILSIIGITILVHFDNKGIYSLRRLLFKTHAPMLTINKTGLLTMETIDIYRYLYES